MNITYLATPTFSLFQKDFSAAFPYAVKACELGELDSCVNVSVMYKRGEGVAADEAKSWHFAKAAKELQRQQGGKQTTLEFGGGS